MSLATRCTACGTIFRIVEDQLRVSDGWVRCGRCAEVFDARALLFDIDQEAPPPQPPAAPPPPTPPTPRPPPVPPAPEPPDEALAARAPTASPAAPARHEPTEPMFDAPDWLATRAEEPEPALFAGDDGVASTLAPGRQEPQWAEDTRLPPALARVAGHAERPLLPPPPPLVPEFMKSAERSARWQRPGVRLALAASSALLFVALLLQALLQFRDALAALLPPAAPALRALCQVAGCELQAWHRIDALSIEASSLNPIGAGNHYRLNLSLRNKTGTDVAAPWLDLTLTDATGVPFARRVFAPAALTPAQDRVSAESEQSLSLSFGTGNQRVSGYKVYVFYP